MNTRSCLYTLLAMCLLALVAACNHRPTADYQLDYAVSPDTAGHYLNVHLTYEADSTLPHPARVPPSHESERIARQLTTDYSLPIS